MAHDATSRPLRQSRWTSGNPEGVGRRLNDVMIGRSSLRAWKIVAFLLVSTLVAAVFAGSDKAATVGGEKEDTAKVMAVAVRQLVEDFPSVGGRRFATYVVEASTDPRAGVDVPDPKAVGRPLTPRERSAIESAIESFGPVMWTEDAAAWWNKHEIPTIGEVAVIRINEPVFDDEGVLVPVSLTCGSLCGTWRTYRLVATSNGWKATGTEGLVGES